MIVRLSNGEDDEESNMADYGYRKGEGRKWV